MSAYLFSNYYLILISKFSYVTRLFININNVVYSKKMISLNGYNFEIQKYNFIM